MNELEKYFAEHPEEEVEFLEEMARLEAEKGPVEFPEDWPMEEVQKEIA